MIKKEDIRIVPDDWVAELDLSRYFDMERPLEVDVGCGKGGFLIERAAQYPDRNYLGIDRMLRRIRKVRNKAVRRGMENVRLLRIDASYAISHMMPAGSVSTYYVFFPDPWPKKRHHSKRFFDADFLHAVKWTLASGGMLHVATDHLPYFREIEELILADGGFRREQTFVPAEHERTEFERYYLKHTDIGRCSFSLV